MKLLLVTNGKIGRIILFVGLRIQGIAVDLKKDLHCSITWIVIDPVFFVFIMCFVEFISLPLQHYLDRSQCSVPPCVLFGFCNPFGREHSLFVFLPLA